MPECLIAGNGSIDQCNEFAMPNLIPFAWSPERLDFVEAGDVAKGKECGCSCPACGKSVMARHPRAKIVRHFAHLSGDSCSFGLETVIHQTAKQLLKSHKKVWLDAVHLSVGNPQEYRWVGLAPTQIFTAKRGEIEVVVGPFRTDVMFWATRGQRLAVEIVVTHPVDAEKKAFYEKERISAIAIDLSKTWKDMTLAALKHLLFVDGSDTTSWIFNDFERRKQKAISNKVVYRKIVWRPSERRGKKVPHVDDCPMPQRQHLTKRFSNVRLDCPRCPYFWLEHPARSSRFVPCIGHLVAELHGSSPRWAACAAPLPDEPPHHAPRIDPTQRTLEL
jgi:hypothetical protein